MPVVLFKAIRSSVMLIFDKGQPLVKTNTWYHLLLWKPCCHGNIDVSSLHCFQSILTSCLVQVCLGSVPIQFVLLIPMETLQPWQPKC